MLRPAEPLADSPLPEQVAAPRAPAVFLSAQWRHLAMLNYAVDAEALRPFVPRGVELDFHAGKCYASLVGFRFLDARLFGVAIPGHRDFDEVNLRFYVRRRVPNGWRRGVVFVREICPRWAVSAVARWVYNERYTTLPMRHRVVDIRSGPLAEYAWRRRGRWERLRVCGVGEARAPEPGSLEEFIIEHYYAYTSQRDGGTLEYRVEHPPWRVWTAGEQRFEADAERLYGAAFGRFLRGQAAGALVADGSAVLVRRGTRIAASP